MSISSAPSATAARVSASLTSSGACPDGNAVATLARCTPEPASSLAAVATLDGDGVRSHGLGAERADLAGGVGAFQRREVDHPDGQVDRPGLSGRLDGTG